jgi:hypothetical protein
MSIGARVGAFSIAAHENSPVMFVYPALDSENLVSFCVFAIVALKLVRFSDILCAILSANRRSAICQTSPPQRQPSNA